MQSFFSTQFVTIRNGAHGSVMELETNTWIFFAITVPLTAGTVLVWALWRVLHKIKFSVSLKKAMALRRTRASLGGSTSRGIVRPGTDP